jgi:hypothetical protein
MTGDYQVEWDGLHVQIVDSHKTKIFEINNNQMCYSTWNFGV